MKVYMSVDMEGIAGIVQRSQVIGEGKDYDAARYLLIKEVNAAVEGAIRGGADEVIVLDAHYVDFNFPIEELHKDAKFIMGFVPPTVRFPFLDESFDMMLLLGYHAMSGTPGAILEHTFSSANFEKITVNGIEMGEIGLDALMCGHYNVPVAMVSGDDKTCAEARRMLGDVETTIVKYGIARTCALTFPPAKAREMICEATFNVVKNKKQYKPFRMEGPYEVEVTYASVALVDKIPGNGKDIILTAPKRVLYKMDSVLGIQTKSLFY